MRIMVVDDSVVFRSQIKASLDGVEGISVVSTAASGSIALQNLERFQCDVITLDLEMPDMNGIEVLHELRKRGYKQKVIVFAAPTKSGAEHVFDAIRAGAVDFIAKPSGVGSLDEALAGIRKELVPKILQFKRREMILDHSAGTSGPTVHSPVEAPHSHLPPSFDDKPSAAEAAVRYTRINVETFKPRIVVIASSTGGPTALEDIFGKLKGTSASVPILIAQHMPPNFTEFLAKRLCQLSGLPGGEARNGETIEGGRIYVAPGDYHLSLQRSIDGGKTIARLDQNAKRNQVRPAADFLFESAVALYGGMVGGLVLTGMGEDGRMGACAIKGASGCVAIQDQETSVVWGMPGSVHAAGAFDAVVSLSECGRILQNWVK